MPEQPENQKNLQHDGSRSTSETTPVSLERLLELMRRSEGLTRKAAASGRALGVLSDSDLRLRIRQYLEDRARIEPLGTHLGIPVL